MMGEIVDVKIGFYDPDGDYILLPMASRFLEPYKGEIHQD
jgi:hypothetical protein